MPEPQPLAIRDNSWHHNWHTGVAGCGCMDRQGVQASARSAGKPSLGTQQRRWLSDCQQDPAPAGEGVTRLRPDAAGRYHSVGFAEGQCSVHPVSAVERRVLVRVCHNPPRLQQRSLCRKHPWVGVDWYPAHTWLNGRQLLTPCVLHRTSRLQLHKSRLPDDGVSRCRLRGTQQQAGAQGNH